MSRTAVKFKPCPFCGNDGSGPVEDALHTILNECLAGSEWTVQCDACTATMGYSDTEDEAIEAWNRRAALAPVEVSVKVKLLEWEEPRTTEDGRIAQDAQSPFSRYIATDTGWFLLGVTGYETERGLEAAKAAAQADYEQRIRSALTPTAMTEAYSAKGLQHPEYAHGISEAELIKEAIAFCDEELDGYEGMEYDDDCEVACQRSNTFIRELARRLAAFAPSDAEQDADEAAIDALRHKAFMSNSEADRQAYFDAVSKWFQHRNYRRMAHPDSSSDAVRITDEMVEKAARALSRFGKSFPTIDDEIEWVDTKWPRYKDEARTALIAALKGEVKK